MKNHLMIAVSLLIPGTALLAQGPGKVAHKDPCGRNNPNKAWMMDSLNLSPDQKTKITAAFDLSCKRIDSLKQADGKFSEANKEKVKQIRIATKKEVGNLLTAEQKEKLKQHHKNELKSKREHHDKKGNSVRKYILDSLNLSNEQKTRINSIYQNSDARINAAKIELKDNKDSLKSFVRNIHKSDKKEIESILSEDQKKQLKTRFGKQENRTPKDPAVKARSMTDRMTSQLGLSKEQDVKVYEINKNFMEKKQALHLKYKENKSGEEFKKENKQLGQDYKKELSTVLTPEQVEKLKSLKKEKHKNEPKED